MSNEENNESRRRFLKGAAGTTAAAVVLGGLPGLARAADLPHLTDADPTAKALDYTDDAAKTKNPKHKPGDDCTNCQFYSGGPKGYGPCALFPGKSVNSHGWCVSHSPKAK